MALKLEEARLAARYLLNTEGGDHRLDWLIFSCITEGDWGEKRRSSGGAYVYVGRSDVNLDLKKKGVAR